MTSPFAGVLVGSIIGVTGTPLVWVFVDKLFDPGPADDLESTLVQLAIAIAYWSFGWGCVTWRHRISVDETARSITWTKSVFGLRWRSETWHQPDMEAVTVERSGRFSSSAYAVGPRGRRPMLTGQLAVSDARWWAKALGVPYHDLRVRWAAPAKPEPPPTVSRLLRSLLLIAIVIPGLFWLKFGELGWDMGFGLAGFLAAIVLAIWYSDRHPDAADAAAASPPAFKRSRFDFLGVIWLLSIPFGPLFGWGATEQITAGNWQAMAGIRVFLGIVLPLVGVLPLLRFVRGPNVAISAVVLLIGTAIPILTARNAAHDLIHGPVWEDVEVKKVRFVEYSAGFTAGGGHWVQVPLVDLSDGRTLRLVDDVRVYRGPMRLLVLRGLDRILDSEP